MSSASTGSSIPGTCSNGRSSARNDGDDQAFRTKDPRMRAGRIERSGGDHASCTALRGTRGSRLPPIRLRLDATNSRMQALKFAVRIEPNGRERPALGIDPDAVLTHGRRSAGRRGMPVCARVRAPGIEGRAGE
jgi:hypothetical protein